MRIIQLNFLDGKVCTKCKEWKAFDLFVRHPKTRDGRSPQCKQCDKAYRQSRGSLAAEATKRWHEKNKERFKVWNRKYSRERGRQKRRALGISKPIPMTYEQRRERARKSVQRWNQRYPEKRRAVMQAYRARRRLSSGTISPTEWRDVCAKYGDKCLCCGADGPLTMDHVIPLSRGGSHSVDNIQPLCSTCNSKKYNKTLDYRSNVVVQ
jgi:5-methylcytosine-specific restriction endonuclease McrA